MKRRLLLGSLMGLMLTPIAAFAEVLDYTDGLIKERLAAGETVFVRYGAVWCSTCNAQKAKLDKLRAENPAYEENVTFVLVDWDTFANAPVTTDRQIPRRSTLLVLDGDQELGRIVAGTRTKDIKALLDTALEAAGG